MASEDQYIKALVDRGWTLVKCKTHDPEAEQWLEECLGDECDNGNYIISKVVGHWEYLGTNEYLIRDPKMAMLFKLTWAGA